MIIIRNKVLPGACAVCAEDDFRVVKEHNHIFGRNNSPIVALECFNYHAKNTYDQNMMPPKARSKNASKADKHNFILISIGSLLEIMGKQLKKMGLEDYGNRS